MKNRTVCNHSAEEDSYNNVLTVCLVLLGQQKLFELMRTLLLLCEKQHPIRQHIEKGGIINIFK